MLKTSNYIKYQKGEAQKSNSNLKRNNKANHNNMTKQSKQIFVKKNY